MQDSIYRNSSTLLKGGEIISSRVRDDSLDFALLVEDQMASLNNLIKEQTNTSFESKESATPLKLKFS